MRDKMRPADLRVRVTDPNAADLLARIVERELSLLGGGGTGATVVCIGTDRSTGDALGPLVGTLLTQESAAGGVTVLGTLAHPVHAGNLDDVATDIARAPRRGPVVAVDACLGRYESIGTVQVHRGPLRPGAGVRKQLPPIGDLSITATVNVGGFMEYVVLQNTRLALVYDLARLITGSLRVGLSACERTPGRVDAPLRQR